ncbi:MAG: hypothetical protein COA99_02065 [Moraxellaceae bacterium]|nr:MAG: hypothetical protein COA99_02065 [Moraxellaceae bacterium]
MNRNGFRIAVMSCILFIASCSQVPSTKLSPELVPTLVGSDPFFHYQIEYVGAGLCTYGVCPGSNSAILSDCGSNNWNGANGNKIKANIASALSNKTLTIIISHGDTDHYNENSAPFLQNLSPKNLIQTGFSQSYKLPSCTSYINKRNVQSSRTPISNYTDIFNSTSNCFIYGDFTPLSYSFMNTDAVYLFHLSIQHKLVSYFHIPIILRLSREQV